MPPRTAATVLGVDWGGSNLRVFRYGPGGEVLETRASGQGAASLEGAGFEAALAALIGDWRLASGAPLHIVMSGMVGARGGWREAPYVPCPADLEAVASARVRLETSLGEAWIVPGLSVSLPGRPADVMRGEETQIFGALHGETEALVVAPGTHSKWCRIQDGRIADFRTYLTGELFAVLRSHSILGRTMEGQAHDGAGFARGMELAMSDPDLPGLLFSVRSEALFGRIAPGAGASYLSGLLIGAEVRAGLARAGGVGDEPILLIAAEGLAGPYQIALAAAGAGAVRCIDGARASARGLWRLAQAGGVRMSWSPLLDETPLIAIVRGVRPEEAVGIGEAVYAAGFRCLEAPLNSPDPLDSIRRLSRAFEGRMLIGAGTVLTPVQVADVAEAGGRLIVSPNADVEVIRASKRAGLISLPGVFTATEAFAALAAGADALKLFPAEAASPLVLKALRAVLPPKTRIFPVGGIDPPSMAAWLQAGAAGFGIGGAVYRPGQSAEQVHGQAAAFIAAWRTLSAGDGPRP